MEEAHIIVNPTPNMFSSVDLQLVERWEKEAERLTQGKTLDTALLSRSVASGIGIGLSQAAKEMRGLVEVATYGK